MSEFLKEPDPSCKKCLQDYITKKRLGEIDCKILERCLEWAGVENSQTIKDFLADKALEKVVGEVNLKSASYRRDIKRILDKFIRWCGKQDYFIDEIPDLSGIIIEKVKRRKAEVPPLDPSCLKTPESKVLYLLIVGSELNDHKMLLYLRFIDFKEDGTCQLKNGRIIKVSPEVMHWVKQIHHKNEEQYIFKIWDNGEAASAKTLQRVWRNGLPKHQKGKYTMRKLFAMKKKKAKVLAKPKNIIGKIDLKSQKLSNIGSQSSLCENCNGMGSEVESRGTDNGWHPVLGDRRKGYRRSAKKENKGGDGEYASHSLLFDLTKYGNGDGNGNGNENGHSRDIFSKLVNGPFKIRNFNG